MSKLNFQLMLELIIWEPYMSENSMLSARTRHADLRQKYTSDLQEKGLIKIDFIRSEHNTSDIMTKNVTVELFDKHVKGILIDKNEIEDNRSSSRKGVDGMLSDLLNKCPINNNSIGQLPQQSCQPDENYDFHTSHDPVPPGTNGT